MMIVDLKFISNTIACYSCKASEIPTTEHVPRVLPKNQDPSLVNRNKRMLGQLLGTLEVCMLV
jgi:hypothetical protein